jgi:GNAT superfamily N-acetyltransferase
LLSPPTPFETAASRCDLSRFACGESDLDHWLRHHAHGAEGRTARTYVVCDDDRVVGYHCLAAGGLDRKHLPRRIRQGPPNPTPVFILGRLARDLEFRGRGIGEDLVAHAFGQCHAAARIVGALGVVVQLVQETPYLVHFYDRLGFRPLHGLPGSMFVELGSIGAD